MHQVDPAIAVRRRRWGVDAAIVDRAEAEAVVREGSELAVLFVPVTEQVLRAALVAAEDEDVFVADRPEVGHGTVFAGSREDIAFHKWALVGPVLQIFREK